MRCSPPICLVGTLVGVGAFADAAIGERAWLELMHFSAMHFPALMDADFVTERTVAPTPSMGTSCCLSTVTFV
ncbi:hypothetical protein ACFUCH_36660 [Streptomyces olivaceus]|uniref:hypothetical protein n=1 Tax=Streptomyces olivaceus TaxID=47716 RepID=UPI003627FDFE